MRISATTLLYSLHLGFFTLRCFKLRNSSATLMYSNYPRRLPGSYLAWGNNLFVFLIILNITHIMVNCWFIKYIDLYEIARGGICQSLVWFIREVWTFFLVGLVSVSNKCSDRQQKWVVVSRYTDKFYLKETDFRQYKAQSGILWIVLMISGF